jgi:hypothetical protein
MTKPFTEQAKDALIKQAILNGESKIRLGDGYVMLDPLPQAKLPVMDRDTNECYIYLHGSDDEKIKIKVW